jgi:hypothetical protein
MVMPIGKVELINHGVPRWQWWSDIALAMPLEMLALP